MSFMLALYLAPTFVERSLIIAMNRSARTHGKRREGKDPRLLTGKHNHSKRVSGDQAQVAGAMLDTDTSSQWSVCGSC